MFQTGFGHFSFMHFGFGLYGFGLYGFGHFPLAPEMNDMRHLTPSVATISRKQ
jgi:hypothetical protein